MFAIVAVSTASTLYLVDRADHNAIDGQVAAAIIDAAPVEVDTGDISIGDQGGEGGSIVVLAVVLPYVGAMGALFYWMVIRPCTGPFRRRKQEEISRQRQPMVTHVHGCGCEMGKKGSNGKVRHG